jgi:hypothetical protein
MTGTVTQILRRLRLRQKSSPASPSARLRNRHPRCWRPLRRHDQHQAAAGWLSPSSIRASGDRGFSCLRHEAVEAGDPPRPDHGTFAFGKNVTIWAVARLNAPVPSMPCCSEINATPAASSSAIACATWRALRPRQPSVHKDPCRR